MEIHGAKVLCATVAETHCADPPKGKRTLTYVDARKLTAAQHLDIASERVLATLARFLLCLLGHVGLDVHIWM